MSDDRDDREKADELEQRYVQERIDVDDELTGLDPQDTDREKLRRVEATSDDEGAAHVERMAGEDT